MKNRILLIFIILFLLSSHSLTLAQLDPIPIPIVLDRRDSVTEISMIVDSSVFTNSTLTIDNVISDSTTLEYKPGNIAYGGSYSFNTETSILDNASRTSMITYLRSIELNTSTTGYEFNNTAFSGGEFNSTFSPNSGSSFNAELTLDWIRDNLWDKDASRYTFYFFNFEDLDIGNQSHWFMIQPNDVDTGEFGNKFYSGTSGLEVGKQVSAWGGRDGLPIHFLDISSITWFGDFINSVWPSNYQGNNIKKNVKDFTDRSSTSYLQWLEGMIIPFYEHSFSNDVFTSVILQNQNDIRLNPTYQIPSIVLFDDPEKLELDSWIISETTMKNTLESSFPFLNFNVSNRWGLLDDYSSIWDTMNSYLQTDSEGQDFVELSDGFLDYIARNELSELFGNVGSDTIPSVIFYLDDIQFRYNNVAISGLGGMGWQLQIVSKDRLYNVDGEKERGFSQVLLHEVGHSMGLPHPFYIFNSWSSDYGASVMGYYTSYPTFSTYDRDALTRLYADYFIIQANYLDNVASSERDIANGQIKLQEAIKLYDEREYSNAVIAARVSIFYFQSAILDSTLLSSSINETPLLFYSVVVGILILVNLNMTHKIKFSKLS